MRSEAQARTGEPLTSAALARPTVWLFHMALPLLGLWLLLARPTLDIEWLYRGAHFLVVAVAAAISTGVGLVVNEAARRRGDLRLFLVGLAFTSSAGFLLMHALTTPGVLLPGSNPGFEFGVPIGLAVSALFAALSALEMSPVRAAAVMRSGRLIRAGVLLVVLAWGIAALLRLPPLSEHLPAAGNATLLRALALCGTPLFLFALVRYYREYRRRGGVVLLSILTAYLLLAEALIAIPLGPVWHMSWWLWHVLMLIGFGYVAYSAHIQYRREGSSAGLFDGVGTIHTVARLRGEYGAALEALVGAMQRREAVDDPGTAREIQSISSDLADRFGLSEGQAAVLGRAAEALSSERTQLARLNALVGIGRETSVILSERELLERGLRQIVTGFEHHAVQIGLIVDGRLRFPGNLSSRFEGPPTSGASQALDTLRPAQDGAGGLVLPLLVKGHAAGVLHVQRAWGQFDQRDRALLESLAAQLSIALENARLYRQIDGLFRQYMSPDVATALLADPAQAALGGALIEVTALFADLRGFTTFSEQVTPGAIVELLNRYFDAATHAVLTEGGTVVQFVGDAMMALFNAPVRQPDHPERAVRAALALQRAIEGLAGQDPDAPRFRVGVNTGAALVGNIGSEQLRNFNAMGDAVNVAARLQTVAEPGTVVIGETTHDKLPGRPRSTPLGALVLKGRQQPVEAFVLHELTDGGHDRD